MFCKWMWCRKNTNLDKVYSRRLMRAWRKSRTRGDHGKDQQRVCKIKSISGRASEEATETIMEAWRLESVWCIWNGDPSRSQSYWRTKSRRVREKMSSGRPIRRSLMVKPKPCEAKRKNVTRIEDKASSGVRSEEDERSWRWKTNKEVIWCRWSRWSCFQGGETRMEIPSKEIMELIA